MLLVREWTLQISENLRSLISDSNPIDMEITVDLEGCSSIQAYSKVLILVISKLKSRRVLVSPTPHLRQIAGTSSATSASRVLRWRRRTHLARGARNRSPLLNTGNTKRGKNTGLS